MLLGCVCVCVGGGVGGGGGGGGGVGEVVSHNLFFLFLYENMCCMLKESSSGCF